MSTSARERRWAVIGSDGRHIWLGRHTDPTEKELTRVAEGLAETGTPGWLAVTEGVYYSNEELDVMMVRPLWGAGDWQDAVAAFRERRRRVLKPG